MKRSVVSLLVLGVGFLLGRLSSGEARTVEAGALEGGGAAVVGNGDVNADGTIDISDAIALLNWLFLGGTAPEPCPSKSGPSGLPDTGQTTCYDEFGASPIDCASDTCAGQDGFYDTGCPMDGRFVDNGDGTVTDTCTGLMWQKDTADINGDGQVDPELDTSDQVILCDALAYCEALTLAGHEDWRLPNVRELQSIVDYGRVGPAIDPEFGALSYFYWSSTSYTPDFEGAWGVHFSDGFVVKDNREFDGHLVRAVRSAP